MNGSRVAAHAAMDLASEAFVAGASSRGDSRSVVSSGTADGETTIASAESLMPDMAALRDAVPVKSTATPLRRPRPANYRLISVRSRQKHKDFGGKIDTAAGREVSRIARALQRFRVEGARSAERVSAVLRGLEVSGGEVVWSPS
jgi:hypothetical protein